MRPSGLEGFVWLRLVLADVGAKMPGPFSIISTLQGPMAADLDTVRGSGFGDVMHMDMETD